MNAAKQSTEQVVLEALAARRETTAAELATATGRGRSTVSKALTKLEHERRVTRTAGGRDGARRLPDRWSTRGKRRGSRKSGRAGGRLRPGQLDELVLDHLRKHAGEGPLGPTAVAKALGRSSGAVGNCLTRLARASEVRETSKHPRRYLAAPGRDRS